MLEMPFLAQLKNNSCIQTVSFRIHNPLSVLEIPTTVLCECVSRSGGRYMRHSNGAIRYSRKYTTM